MGLVLLQFFNRYFDDNNNNNNICLEMSRNAYTVFLIHPIIITILTSIFIKVYNSIHGYEVIAFDANNHNNFKDEDYFTIDHNVSNSTLLGPGKGGLHLFIGFLCVWILTNMISWPVASMLTRRIRFLQS